MPTDTPERVIEAAGSLITRGARCVIAKMGGRGAMLITSDDAIFCPAFPAKPVDTTAAGDAFNAGLAYALASGQTPYEAMRYANAVGALTVMGQGAQSAMPTREQVTVFMNR
jgi:ribokinase